MIFIMFDNDYLIVEAKLLSINVFFTDGHKWLAIMADYDYFLKYRTTLPFALLGKFASKCYNLIQIIPKIISMILYEKLCGPTFLII